MDRGKGVSRRANNNVGTCQSSTPQLSRQHSQAHGFILPVEPSTSQEIAPNSVTSQPPDAIVSPGLTHVNPTHKRHRSEEADNDKGKRQKRRNENEDEKKGGVLACLFFRFDPFRYSQCVSKKMTRFSDLIQHFERNHSQPDKLCCPSCWGTFESEDGLDSHSKDCKEQRPCPFLKASEIKMLKDDLKGNKKKVWDTLEGRIPDNYPTSELKTLYVWYTKFSHEPLDSPYLEDFWTEVSNVLLKKNSHAVLNLIENTYAPLGTKIVDIAYDKTPPPPRFRLGEGGFNNTNNNPYHDQNTYTNFDLNFLEQIEFSGHDELSYLLDTI